MIYTLKASKRKFEVLGSGDEFAKVRFLGGRKDDEVTFDVKDLAGSSDWTPPAKEEPPVATPVVEQPNFGWYGGPIA